jgi:hypothetical protein
LCLRETSTAMAMCSVCSGYGWTYGDYNRCSSCGGSGHGNFTNISCMYCGGSGTGSTRQQLTCFGCGGLGTVPGTDGYSSSTSGSKAGRSKTPPKPRQPPRPWTRSELYALVPAFIASALGLHHYFGVTGWWLATAIFPAVIIVREWKPILVIGALAAGVWFISTQV